MSDIDENCDIEIEQEEIPSDSVSESGKSAIQGRWQGEKWSHVDGSIMHSIYEQKAYDELDNPEEGISVWNEEPIFVADAHGNKKIGKVDTRIDHGNNTTLIDYKTNDMNDWTEADGRRFGHEHGEKMKEYMESNQTPVGSLGYIIQCGRLPKNEYAKRVYSDSIEQYGGKVLFPDDGTPESVIGSVREAMEKTEEKNRESG
jgi:hypothetical protein